MAEPSTHINYSFEDIQRYLQGNMSAAEMHDIEKVALQDPFLADAIEGYTEVDASLAEQHLNEINAGLFAEKQKSKVVAFNKKTQWLSIAAIIIVIAGIALFSVYTFNGAGKKQEIAQVKEETANNNKILKDSEVVMANAAPPAIKKEEPVIAQNQIKTKNTKKKESSKALTSTGKETQAEEDNATSIVASAAPVHQNEMVSRSFTTADAINKNNNSIEQNLQGKVSGLNVLPNTFSGKVVDENNKPIPMATIESADKKTAVVTDMNGDFSLQKNDTILNVIASSVAYEQQKVNLQSGHNNTIVLKEYKPDLNEVVVIGYGTKRKRYTGADSIMPVARKALSDSAEPVGGWQNFNNYVLSQLNKDTAAQSINDPNDLVELEFLIDNAGNPYNFKIVKPLDAQHNAKAIEILKSGPKWTSPSKNKKAKVAINF